MNIMTPVLYLYSLGSLGDFTIAAILASHGRHFMYGNVKVPKDRSAARPNACNDGKTSSSLSTNGVGLRSLQLEEFKINLDIMKNRYFPYVRVLDSYFLVEAPGEIDNQRVGKFTISMGIVIRCIKDLTPALLRVEYSFDARQVIRSHPTENYKLSAARGI